MLVLSLVVKSSAFAPNQPIPKEHSCQGKDTPPPLEVDLPPTAQSWAMIVDDPDASSGTFVHWTVWNLPAKEKTLGAKIPDGARQGKNDFGKTGWGGPCPPPGKPHHYRFRVFALDGKIDLAAGSSASDLEHAVKGHVVGEGTLVGTYQR
jgi:Raf kinase inhibitor-like YbhB/YbcL family protein